MRGYIPDNREFVERQVTEAVDSLPFYSAELKQAMKESMECGQYLLRELISIFRILGDLSVDAVRADQQRQKGISVQIRPVPEVIGEAIDDLQTGVEAVVKQYVRARRKWFPSEDAETLEVGKSAIAFVFLLGRVLGDLGKSPSLAAVREVYIRADPLKVLNISDEFKSVITRVAEKERSQLNRKDLIALYRASEYVSYRSDYAGIWFLAWSYQTRGYMKAFELNTNKYTLRVLRKLSKNVLIKELSEAVQFE